MEVNLIQEPWGFIPQCLQRVTINDVRGVPWKWLPSWNKDWKVRCIKCNNTAWEEHHITYNPSQIVRLCVPCHSLVTKYNTNLASRRGRKITDDERLAVFELFMEGNEYKEFIIRCNKSSLKEKLETLNIDKNKLIFLIKSI